MYSFDSMHDRGGQGIGGRTRGNEVVVCSFGRLTSFVFCFCYDKIYGYRMQMNPRHMITLFVSFPRGMLHKSETACTITPPKTSDFL